MASTAKKLVTGSFLRVITIVISMSTSLFMLPFIIKSLGDEWYGLWALIASIFSFYAFLDAGVSSATQRFIAFVLPKNDPQELNEVINTSLAIYLFISCISVLVTISIAASASLFIDSDIHLDVFRTVVIILGIGMSSNFPFMVLNGILTANLRYDIASYITLTKLAIRVPLLIYFLSQGYSLIAFATITVLTDLTGNVITLFYAKHLAPHISVNRKYISRERIPELVHYAKYKFISIIADRLRFSTDNFIIAGFLSLSSITTMQVATQLASYFSRITVQALSVMFPVFTGYAAEKNYKALSESFISASRIAVIVSIIMAGGILIFSDTFISLWLGEDYSNTYTILIVMLIAALVESIHVPSANIIYALSQHKYYAYLGLIEAICNVILSLILVQHYGLMGVALGTAIPTVILRFSFLPYFSCKLLRIKPRIYIQSIVYLFLFCTLFQLPIYWLDSKLEYDSLFELFGIAIGLYTPLILVVCNLLLSKEEKDKLINTLPKSKYFIFNR